MRKIILLFVLAILLFSASCSEEDNPLNQVLDTKITAKESVASVLQEARQGFSTDAQLAMIYGRNVGTDGQIDLTNFSSVRAFVYVVQSDSKQSNEFYVPVFGAGPVKSPINFNSMLGLINNDQAKNTMGTVFGTLSGAHVAPGASYLDSDQSISIAMSNGGSAYMNANTGTQIDMFLVPSKSININGLVDSADWIVHFYSSNTSLVLWINSGTGIVTEL